MCNAQVIKERVREQQKAKGIKNSDEMMEELNLGVNIIRQMSDKKGVGCFALAKIADYLDCSVDYLLGRTDDPNRHSVFTVSGVSISGDNHNGIRAVNTGNLTVSNGPKLNEMEQHLLEAFRALDFSQKIETVSSLMKLAQKKSPSDDT